MVAEGSGRRDPTVGEDGEGEGSVVADVEKAVRGIPRREIQKALGETRSG